MADATINGYPPNPSQDVIEKTFGALVTGMWMQQFFCGVLYCYFREYYDTPNKDPIFTKTLVVVLCLLNMLLFACDL